MITKLTRSLTLVLTLTITLTAVVRAEEPSAIDLADATKLRKEYKDGYKDDADLHDAVGVGGMAVGSALAYDGLKRAMSRGTAGDMRRLGGFTQFLLSGVATVYPMAIMLNKDWDMDHYVGPSLQKFPNLPTTGATRERALRLQDLSAALKQDIKNEKISVGEIAVKHKEALAELRRFNAENEEWLSRRSYVNRSPLLKSIASEFGVDTNPKGDTQHADEAK